MRDRGLVWLGALALVFYGVHAGYHVVDGHAENALWVCHAAAVMVGVGLLVRSAAVNAVGVLCLLAGFPLWILDLIGGDKFLPTSLLTHVGALAIGLVGVRMLGMPPQTWSKAAAFLVAMHLVARWVTPREANVNLAFAVWPGWESQFPSHSVYVLTVLAGCSIGFLGAEHVLRLVLANKPARSAS